MLTGNSTQSRNFSLGVELGRGRSLEDCQDETREGVATARAVVRLAARYRVEMPITRAVEAILTGQRSVEQAVTELLQRPLKWE